MLVCDLHYQIKWNFLEYTIAMLIVGVFFFISIKKFNKRKRTAFLFQRLARTAQGNMTGKVDGLKRFVMQPTPNVPHHCQRPALNVMSSVPFWRKKLEIFIEKSRVDLVWGFCPSYIEGQFSCFYCGEEKVFQ